LGDRRPEDHFTQRYGLDRPNDLVLSRVLEDVAGRTGAQGGEYGIVVIEHRENKDARRSARSRKNRSRVDPVHLGHVDVHHHDIRSFLLGDLDRFAPRGGTS
jgi:hypothetical protein